MNSEEIIKLIENISKELIKLCEVTGTKVDCYFSPDDDKGEKSRATGWLTVGDYDFENHKYSGVFYRPIGHTNVWQNNVDVNRIVSFTEPPMETEKEGHW